MTYLDHLEQAKFWLSAAKYVFGLQVETRNKYTVASALAIHAAIKANDSLTTRFLGRVARRHEDAPALFLELVKEELPPERRGPSPGYLDRGDKGKIRSRLPR